MLFKQFSTFLVLLQLASYIFWFLVVKNLTNMFVVSTIKYSVTSISSWKSSEKELYQNTFQGIGNAVTLNNLLVLSNKCQIPCVFFHEAHKVFIDLGC